LIKSLFIFNDDYDIDEFVILNPQSDFIDLHFKEHLLTLASVAKEHRYKIYGEIIH